MAAFSASVVKEEEVWAFVTSCDLVYEECVAPGLLVAADTSYGDIGNCSSCPLYCSYGSWCRDECCRSIGSDEATSYVEYAGCVPYYPSSVGEYEPARPTCGVVDSVSYASASWCDAVVPIGAKMVDGYLGAVPRRVGNGA